jgi:hypothetical protein
MTSIKLLSAAGCATTAATLILASFSAPRPLEAQDQGDSVPSPNFRERVREASRLDTRGRTAEARVVFQRLIDSAATPAARASAQRAMAMSFGFDGDCPNTVKYEEMVIAYWKTREREEPQNAFYQQGEMANEGARVCIDVGELAMAEKYYRMGSELGLKEPEPRTHPRSLWDYRLAHALGRLAARRGDRAEAHRQIAPRAVRSTATRPWPTGRSATSRTSWGMSRFTPMTCKPPRQN